MRTGKKTSSRQGWVDALTRNFGKALALITVIAAIVTNLDTIVGAWRKIFETVSPHKTAVTQPQPSCIQNVDVNFPDPIKYSEWNDAHISVTGQNNCNRGLGLYVTFARRLSQEPPRLDVRPAFEEEEPACASADASVHPNCWDHEKPVPINQGRWQWEAPLPPLFKRGEPRQTETIGVELDVRDFDAPGASPLWSRSVIIKVVKDTTDR
jgi:hypothetical protein